MMNADRRRNAFTLIEVLIVVVIMAVLAATVIPQFTSSTKDAQNSTVEFNARTLRAQIELYKAHHNGAYPSLTTGAQPEPTDRLHQRRRRHLDHQGRLASVRSLRRRDSEEPV